MVGYNVTLLYFWLSSPELRYNVLLNVLKQEDIIFRKRLLYVDIIEGFTIW